MALRVLLAIVLSIAAASPAPQGVKGGIKGGSSRRGPQRELFNRPRVPVSEGETEQRFNPDVVALPPLAVDDRLTRPREPLEPRPREPLEPRPSARERPSSGSTERNDVRGGSSSGSGIRTVSYPVGLELLLHNFSNPDGLTWEGYACDVIGSSACESSVDLGAASTDDITNDRLFQIETVLQEVKANSFDRSLHAVRPTTAAHHLKSISRRFEEFVLGQVVTAKVIIYDNDPLSHDDLIGEFLCSFRGYPRLPDCMARWNVVQCTSIKRDEEGYEPRYHSLFLSYRMWQDDGGESGLCV